MKIYTKSGDNGITSLFGGLRVEKNSPRIKAYGEIDELNSLIGLILAEFADHPGGVRPPLGIKPLKNKLLRIQKELFVLGSDLATPFDVKTKVPRITKRYIKRLEEEIDSWSEKLPKLHNFILPGGCKIGSSLHLARSIARRTERSIVDLEKEEKLNKSILPYINRFSDWLFVLARYMNKVEGISEKIWRGRSKI